MLIIIATALTIEQVLSDNEISPFALVAAGE